MYAFIFVLRLRFWFRKMVLLRKLLINVNFTANAICNKFYIRSKFIFHLIVLKMENTEVNKN